MEANTVADRKQIELARSLVGKEVKWNHKSGPDDPKYRVLQMWSDGLIELEGWSGGFAPHLFVVADSAGAATE
jgi:hypothetical protein